MQPQAADPATANAAREAQFVEQLGGRLDLFATPAPLVYQAPTLRAYQAQAIADVRREFAAGARRVLLQLPTGGGKTQIIAFAAAEAAKLGSGVVILAHRAELLEQISDALARWGIRHGLISPDAEPSDAPVQVASVQTLARRLRAWQGKFSLLIVDEAHHAVAGSWAAVLASQRRAHVLGLSATPERLDGRGLHEQFDALVCGPQTAALIAASYLSPFVVYEPSGAPDLSGTSIRAGDYAIVDLKEFMGGVLDAAVAEFLRICPAAPAIAFCVDVQHSEALAARFRDAGVVARHLDGETPSGIRRATLRGLVDGSVRIVTNCGLIAEGLDVPNVGAALLLRPTASLALYLQQIGRALRPAPEKERAVILDFAGNVSRHGMPDESREWSLDARPRRQRGASAAPRLRRCPSCCVVHRASARQCSKCGADLRTAKERAEFEIVLRETQRRELEAFAATLPYRAALEWAGVNLDRLRMIARAKGFKPGWVYNQHLRASAGGSR